MMEHKSWLHPTTGRHLKFGRNYKASAPSLKLGRYLNKSNLPTTPDSVNYSLHAESFLHNICGNDSLGDCTAAGVGHLAANILGLAGKSIPFTARDAINFYSRSTGYVPSEPWTDNGGNEPDVLNYWRAHGFIGGQHKISGWVQVDAGNQRELQVGVYLFGGLYLGLCLPDAYEPTGDFNNGFLWDVEGDSDPSNGHCIVALGYSRTGLIVDTWGYLGTLTWAAVAKYCSSDSNGMINAVVSPDIIESVTRKSPSGLYFSQLLADFDHFFGA